MTILATPNIATYTVVSPADLITATCAVGDHILFTWLGAAGVSGRQLVRDTTVVVGPWPLGTVVTMTAVRGNPDWAVGTTSGAGGATAYLGQMATRCYLLNNSTPIANVWQGGCSGHYARGNLVNPIVEFANARIASANAEQGFAAGMIKASIEYPLGTYTLADACVSAGNAAVVFPSSLIPLQLKVSGVSIPDGAFFRVHELITGIGTLVWCQAQSNFNMLLTQDGFDNGTGAPVDRTTGTGGTYPQVVNFGYYPVAILGMTTRPSVAIIGDSRQVGGREYCNDAYGDVGEIARIVGADFGYINLGISATLGSQYLATSRTLRDYLVTHCSHPIVAYGVNDVAGGATAAAVAATRASIAALYPTKKVLGTTIAPYTTSTDGFATTTNQSLGTNQPIIRALNRLIRAGIAGELAVIDIADMIDPTRRNGWPVSYNQNDTARATSADFTASVATTGVMTVTAIISGAINYADPYYSADGTFACPPGSTVLAQLSGTAGSTGTYQVYPPPTAAITSREMKTGSFASDDGLHMTGTMAERVRDVGRPTAVALITR